MNDEGAPVYEDIPVYELLRRIDLGSGVAEHDNLLWKCMVETQHFMDLLTDRVDLVLGSKGSGKSSLFRMFGELLSDTLYKDWQTIAVSGVETKGEPVFKKYAKNFEEFSEDQFETFWKAYLLSLVYNKIFNDRLANGVFSAHETELNEFKKEYQNLGLTDVGYFPSPTKLLKVICALTVAAVEGARGRWDIERGELVFGMDFSERVGQRLQAIAVPDLSKMDTVLCLDALATLAERSGYKIWIILDHLDVVFKRRSHEEARALRALLRVMYAFSSTHLRLKIFLRDDILDAISSGEQEPLAGLSHITSRAGANLKWTPDSLCVMIMKRLAANYRLSDMYDVDEERVGDVDYARSKFQEIFALKYVKQTAFDWIVSLLSDGRGVVTPRDLIDLLKRAFHVQSLWLEKHPDSDEFMSIAAIKEAHGDLSKDRKETVLQTEFSHLMHWIHRLERNKEKYERAELAALFGGECDKAISTLQAIGVVQFDHKKSCYRVAKLYGPGLQVFATRARRGSAGSSAQ